MPPSPYTTNVLFLDCCNQIFLPAHTLNTICQSSWYIKLFLVCGIHVFLHAIGIGIQCICTYGNPDVYMKINMTLLHDMTTSPEIFSLNISRTYYIMTEPVRSNVRFHLEDINASCLAFEDPKLPTLAYSIVGSKTACAMYNKDLSDPSNKIIAKAIGTPQITVTGTPIAGQVLTAQTNSTATWRTPEVSGTTCIIYVSILGTSSGDGNVGNPYSTIGEAISANRDTEVTIMVLPGTYPEYIYVTAGMTIIGTPNTNIYGIYNDETSSFEGNVTIIGCNFSDTTTFDMTTALANLNLFMYDCTVNTLNTNGCPLSLVNCRVIDLLECRNGNIYIRGSNVNSYNAFSTAEIYNSYVLDMTIQYGAETTLKTAGTTVVNGTVTSASIGSLDIDHLASITTNDFTLFKPVNHGKVNISGSNIGIASTSTTFTDPDGYTNEDCIIIGNNSTISSSIDNSIAIGSNVSIAESNTVAFPDTINKFILKGLESSAGGSTIVFNPTTGRLSYATSSRNEKKDIKSHDLNKSVDIVNTLEVNTFTWKRDDTSDVGFIAEDVAEVDRTLVAEDEEGKIRGINHVRLFPHIIATLQHMQKRIDSLEEQLSKQ